MFPNQPLVPIPDEDEVAKSQKASKEGRRATVFPNQELVPIPDDTLVGSSKDFFVVDEEDRQAKRTS